jgi:hypothetical protein
MRITPVSSYYGRFGSNDQGVAARLQAMEDDITGYVNKMNPNDPHAVSQLGGMYYMFQEFKTTFGTIQPPPSWVTDVHGFDTDSDRFHDAYTALQKDPTQLQGVIDTLSTLLGDLDKGKSAITPQLFAQMMADQIQHKLWSGKPGATTGYLFNGKSDDKFLDHLKGYMELFDQLAQCTDLPPAFGAAYSQFKDPSGPYQYYLNHPTDATALANVHAAINDMLAPLPTPTPS